MILENNEGFEKYGLDWTKFEPWAPFTRITDPVEQDSAMRSAAIAYIFSHPAGWLKGDLDRLERFLTPSDLTFSKFQRQASAVVFYLTLAGAIASLLYNRSWGRLAPLLIPIAFLSALHLSTHALPRYRSLRRFSMPLRRPVIWMKRYVPHVAGRKTHQRL